MARGAGGVKGLSRMLVSCCLAVCLSAGLVDFASWMARASLASVFLMLEGLSMMAW